MAKTICIINGHPDGSEERLMHALLTAYAEGATKAGHKVETITIGELELSFLDSAEEYRLPPDGTVLQERDKIAAADHVVLGFPLWLGGMPAKTRAFLEQVSRQNFFLGESEHEGGWPKKLMKGKSARIVVTMGMPAAIYHLFMDDGVLKVLERGMLGISGFKPIKHNVFGGVEHVTTEKRAGWIEKMAGYGAKAV